MTSALLNTRLTAMIKILSLAPVTFPNLPAEIVEEGLWRSTESRGLKAIKRLFQHRVMGGCFLKVDSIGFPI